MKNVLLMSALAFGCEAADEAFEDEEQSLRSIDEFASKGTCDCECVGCFTDTSVWCKRGDSFSVRVLQSEITKAASEAELRLTGSFGPTRTSIAFSHRCVGPTYDGWCNEQYFSIGAAPKPQPAVPAVAQAKPRNLVVIRSDLAKIEPLFLQPGTCS